MRDAYRFDVDNLFAQLIPDGKRRHIDAMMYILKHGKFPSPICLLHELQYYSIVDGNHRFVAWLTAREAANAVLMAEAKRWEPEKIAAVRRGLSEKWEIKSINPISDFQETWIAS